MTFFKFITLLYITLSLSFAMAQTRHVVFNIDGTLVQAIPAKNYAAFNNKDQMISVTQGTRTLYYYMYPAAAALIEYLQKSPDYNVHFATAQSKDWAESVLKQMNIKYTSLLSAPDMVASRVDLTKVSKDLSQVMLFTSFQNFAIAGQEKNEFFLGKGLYFFESFDISQTEKAKVPAAAQVNFPATEEEWFTEQNKIAFIYQVLKEAPTTGSFQTAINNLKVDKVKMTKAGTLASRYKFLEKILLFRYSVGKTKALGCGFFSSISNSFVEDRPMSECIKATSIKYSYRFDATETKSTGCEIKELGTGAYIQDEPNEDKCFEGVKSEVQYFWQGSTKVSCGSYLKTTFLSSVDKSNCSHYFLVSENGKLVVKTFFEYDGKLISSIPEVMSLKNGEAITSKIYRKYDSALIAKSLIQRVHLNFEKDAMEAKPDYDFMKDTRIAMQFNASYTESISKNCFLNQHDTGTSKGVLDLQRRIGIENGLLNMTLTAETSADTKIVNRIRPKYAYVLLDIFREDLGLNQMYNSYGNVVAIFNDEVKTRSTFTAGDSLNVSATYRDIHTYFYRSKDKVINNKPTGNYFENQTWGKLCVDDVDHFLVNCFENIPQERIDALKLTGKPVFGCKALYHKGNVRAYNVIKTTRL